MKKIVWLLVVIILALILVGILGKKDVEEYTLDNFVSENNAVVLADQIPGDRTVVSYVKLEKPGYVLVFGENEEGDKIFLGSSNLLPAGDSFNTVIQHREGIVTTTDTEVSALVVADDGDGMFNEELDNDQISNEDKADVDAQAQDPATLTIVEIGAMIDGEGFDVTADNVLEEEPTEADMEAEVEAEADMEAEVTEEPAA